jgi:hypothetical protein
MSYYMMGIKFWSEVSLLFALLPLLAVLANGLVRVVSRAFSTNAPRGTLDEDHRRGVVGFFCRIERALSAR